MASLCKLVPGRKYLRSELNDIAKKCNIKNITKYKKQELYDLILSKSSEKTTIKNDNEIKIECIKKFLKECNITSNNVQQEIINLLAKHNNNVVVPTSVKEISIKSPNVSVHSDDNTKNNYVAFSEFFEEDLLGFVKYKKKPNMRAFVPGGYGIKMLLEHNYNIHNKINTKDLDITISIHDAKFSVKKAFTYLLNKCKEFIQSRSDPENFKLETISLPTYYNPILKMRRFYVISIYYKKDEFVDLAITDKEILPSQMNVDCSKKCKLPIKTDEEYFKEYFQIIYMENVPGIDHYCYLKRNPVTGKFSCKGVKDIDRVRLLCDKSTQSKKFKSTCNLMKSVQIDKLKSMTKEDRDKVFLCLRDLV